MMKRLMKAPHHSSPTNQSGIPIMFRMNAYCQNLLSMLYKPIATHRLINPRSNPMPAATRLIVPQTSPWYHSMVSALARFMPPTMIPASPFTATKTLTQVTSLGLPDGVPVIPSSAIGVSPNWSDWLYCVSKILCYSTRRGCSRERGMLAKRTSPLVLPLSSH